ncbi:sentrin-specific protease 1-like isoform X2 [Petromyzon marinus]|uniref:sentrin-specific protease 1-like isoform X2 n=1 Tax=Petromyzon marinus TaxID=7757 RepID=UPI003F717481
MTEKQSVIAKSRKRAFVSIDGEEDEQSRQGKAKIFRQDKILEGVRLTGTSVTDSAKRLVSGAVSWMSARLPAFGSYLWLQSSALMARRPVGLSSFPGRVESDAGSSSVAAQSGTREDGAALASVATGGGTTSRGLAADGRRQKGDFLNSDCKTVLHKSCISSSHIQNSFPPLGQARTKADLGYWGDAKPVVSRNPIQRNKLYSSGSHVYQSNKTPVHNHLNHSTHRMSDSKPKSSEKQPQQHQPPQPPKENPFKSVYDKAFSPIPQSTRSTQTSRSFIPKGTNRRYPTTLHQIIRHEEHKKYQQLVEMYSSMGRGDSMSLPWLRPLLPSNGTLGSGSALCSPSNSTVASSATSPRADEESPRVSPEPHGAQRLEQSSASHSTGSTSSDSLIFVKMFPPKPMKPSFSAILQNSLTESEQWLKNIKSKYDGITKDKGRHILEETIKSQLYEERRAQQEKDLSEQIRERLLLAERAPAVVEEIPEPEHVEEERIEDVEFPPLTEEMEEEIDRAFGYGSTDEVLSEAFRLSITRKDIKTLQHLNWLNDEVINFYMSLIMERGKGEGKATVHAFNTFFYPRVKSAGFQGVKRWTKRVDVFQFDLALVPIHLDVHWCLAAINFKKKTLTYYDSMGNSNNEVCNILMQYLREESKDKKGQPFDITGWKTYSMKPNEIPQQMNGSDCGMFACKYADYITREKPITFTQQHMPYFRRRMVWEIIHQKLL